MSCYSFRGIDGDASGSGTGLAADSSSAILVCDTALVGNSWNTDGSDYGTRVYADWTHGLHFLPDDPPDQFSLHLYSFFYNPVRRPVSAIRIVPRLEIIDRTTIRLITTNRAYGATQERDNFGIADNHPAFKAIIQRLGAGSAAPLLSVHPLYSIEGIYDVN